MRKLTINKSLGSLPPKKFQTWFEKQFPDIKDEWEKYYKDAGGKMKTSGSEKGKPEDKKEGEGN